MVAKIATLMVAMVAGFATMVAATLATLKLAYRILQSGHNFYSINIVYRLWVRVATVATVATVDAIVAKIATIRQS